MDIRPKHLARAQEAGNLLNRAAKSVAILKNLQWSGELRAQFLANGKLPTPSYRPVDVSTPLELVQQARTFLDGDNPVFEWLRRSADALNLTAHMLNARGTPAFSKHSQELYGTPTNLLLDGQTKVIDLAHHMDATLAGLDFSKLVIEGYETHMSAQAFARKLKPYLKEHFRKKAPRIEIVETLSAKALAGSKRIRLRASATFTGMDIHQLLQHEAFVHAATSLNGRAQNAFPILGRAHAGTTETQEGLAVFAEMISGAMDPRRFRRLADRVIAIDMAINGADFKDVFDFYVNRTDDPDQSFENARRIFRGGVITGGAPFTKDMVYLNGLLRVHNFMRTVVKLGRADLIRLMFVGKLDIEDIPALATLADHRHLHAPAYLPPWAKDLRFLVSYLAYSSFLNKVKLPGLQTYYQDALEEVPVIWALTDTNG